MTANIRYFFGFGTDLNSVCFLTNNQCRNCRNQTEKKIYPGTKNILEIRINKTIKTESNKMKMN